MALLRSEPNYPLELTQPEMLDISRWINREFAPRYNSPMVKKMQTLSFAAQELLSISVEISREFTPLSREASANLVLLPIDTRHVYAYWKIEQGNSSALTALKPPEPLTLRIFTQPSLPLASPVADAASPAWFDIRIDAADRHQSVELPGNTAYSGAVSAAIGLGRGSLDFTPILVSNNIELSKPGEVDAYPGQKKAILSAAVSQFILPGPPASSPNGKHSV